MHVPLHRCQPLHERRGQKRRVNVGMLFLRRLRYFFFPPPQVILRLLDPSMSPVLDPYSPEAVARLTLTNLRIRLLKAQSCPPPAETSSPEPTLTSAAPYAVSTLLARGTCLCHGHSDRCRPPNGSRDQGRGPNMVRGFSNINIHITLLQL